ncbi:MAG: FtsX-like permease family protein [Brachybacterium sp.]|nr:FtsX-like permease family protein [Brachybacterium sp.]
MSTLLLIARTLRRQRGRLAALCLLSLLGAAVAHLALVIATDHQQNLAQRMEALSTSDTLFLSSGEDQRTADLLDEREDITRVETTPVQATLGTLRAEDTDLSGLFVFSDPQTDPAMNRAEILEVSATSDEDGVIVPFTLRGAGYDIGDELVITADGTEHTFRIDGFFESPYFTNIGYGTLQFLTTADVSSWTQSWTMTAADVRPGSDTDALVAEIADQSRSSQPAGTQVREATKEVLASGSSLGSGVFTALLLGFAVVLLAVVVIVMRQLIVESILLDARAVGALKAQGFTSGQIVIALAAPYAAGGLLAALAGIAAARLLLPTLADSLEQQGVVTWDPSPGVAAAVGTIALTVLPIALAALSGAARVRRITPVVALRSGLAAHSFRRQGPPLARTRAPIPLALGLRSLMTHPGRSVATAAVMVLVMMVAVFALTLGRNVDSLSTLLVGDIADTTVTSIPADQFDDTLAEIQGMPEVAAAVPQQFSEATIGGRSVQLAVMEDFSAKRSSSVFAGREPRHANEIVIGTAVVDSTGAGIGETVQVTHRGATEDFLVVGHAQGAQMMGSFADITFAGLQRMDADSSPTGIWVYAQEGTDAETLTRVIAERDLPGTTENLQDTLDAQIRPYAQLLASLTYGVIALTALTIALVTFIVVSQQIAAQRRELAVAKALGSTSRDLRAQLLAGMTPLLLAGIGIGAVVGAAGAGPAFGVLLHGVGLRNVDLGAHLLPVLLLATGVFALGVALTWAATLRIRRISAYAMLIE